MLDMDQYRASIESVDNALNRLNQTLASYKLLLSEPAETATTTPISGKNNTNGSRAGHSPSPQTKQGAPSPSNKVAASPEKSSVAASKAQPDRSPAESLGRTLRSTNSYPEVCTGQQQSHRQPVVAEKVG